MNPAPVQRTAPAETPPARILRRMNESGGFPALDQSVARIVEALEIGEEDTSPLVEAVLADVSLTQKVLRLANSAMYAPIGGSVSTVSHAMKVLGFEAIGHLALGVKLIGSLGQICPDSRLARRELAQSLLAGSVAGSVVAKAMVKNGEMGIVCTLLHRLGQLLTAFYLPDEWAHIRRAVEAGQEEREAARAVLGMTLEELGIHIAGQWRLPAPIVARLGDVAPSGDNEEDTWLNALTHFSHRSADLIATSAGKTPAPSLDELVTTFAPLLGVRPDDLVEAVSAATDEATAEPLLAGILREPRTAPPRSVSAPSDAVAAAAAAVSAPVPAEATVGRLKADLAALRQALARHEDRRDLENTALAAAFAGLRLGRVALLRLDAQRRVYRVTAFLCERESDRLAELVIPSGTGADLVHLALTRKLDVYIDNPRDDKIAPRVPAWIANHGTHPFFLLPITDTAGDTTGLVFGQQREDAKLTREELGLLAELRDLLRR